MLRYTWLDVFAAAPFRGNQLCVFMAPADLPVTLMQQITRELNHSETTFIQPSTRSDADFRLRIFIPTPPLADEIPFAGHPILGSACAVAAGHTGPSVVRFETGVGVMPVTVMPDGQGAWQAEMTQPWPRLVRQVPKDGLAAALGLSPADLHPHLPVEAVDNGMRTVLVPLASLAAVQRAGPDLAALRERLGRDGMCVLAFAPGGVDPGTHVHARVFSPFDAVVEDPATGSANGPLGEYLVRHGVVGGAGILSEQGYEIGRPSQLRITVMDGQVRVGGRVQLAGSGCFAIE